MEITWWVISGTGLEENRGKGMGNKKHKWSVENTQGEVKNSAGHEEVEELICTTHGHETKRRGMQVGWRMQGRGE